MGVFHVGVVIVLLNGVMTSRSHYSLLRYSL